MKKKLLNLFYGLFVLFMIVFMMFADNDLTEEISTKSITKGNSVSDQFNYNLATYFKMCEIEKMMIGIDRIFYQTYGYTINDYTLLNKGGIK